MTAPIRNIVLIVGDRHRQDCLGCYGNPVVRTPTAKYIFNAADVEEFYDLEADPWEMENLLDEAGRPSPAMDGRLGRELDVLRQALVEHATATGDPLLGALKRLL